jgi:hypothetical protein
LGAPFLDTYIEVVSKGRPNLAVDLNVVFLSDTLGSQITFKVERLNLYIDKYLLMEVLEVLRNLLNKCIVFEGSYPVSIEVLVKSICLPLVMEFLRVFAIELAKNRDQSLLISLSLLEFRDEILLLVPGEMSGTNLGNKELGVVSFKNLGGFLSNFVVDLCGEIGEHGRLELPIFFDGEN